MLVILLLFTVAAVGAGIMVRRRRYQGYKAISSVLFVIGGAALLPFLLPYLGVGVFAVRCGHWPVIASNFYSSTYDTPGSPEYIKDINPFISAYFCSVKDAESQGYNDNPLNTAPAILR